MGDPGIIIVGSGFGGLGMGIQLKRQGIEDFVILERANEVGGTWRDHVYPGCNCDINSHLYSFSFAPNPDWKSTHSGQPDILAYLQECCDRFGIRPHIDFNCDVRGAEWDDEAMQWRLETSQGPRSTPVLIMAVGPVTLPFVPKLAGLEHFEGAAFHSAAWNHDHDLTGERVAVIGTGSSSTQFVPEIQPQVRQLHVFQRTPPWIVPKLTRRTMRLERRLYARIPAVQKMLRAIHYCRAEALVLGFRHPRVMRLTVESIARTYLRLTVRDRELRRKLTPGYRLGCKRLVNAEKYLPAIVKPNVEVVTQAIREVRKRSIVTEDGTEREVDTILFGTGYNFTGLELADRIVGRNGVPLANSVDALRGTAFAGFPNMFMIIGPNTGTGHTTLVYTMESQMTYILSALKTMRESALAAVSVRPEAQRAYNERLQTAMRGTVWTAGGCRSHYMEENGRVKVLWPHFSFLFRAATRRFDPAEYELQPTREYEPRAPKDPGYATAGGAVR